MHIFIELLIVKHQIANKLVKTDNCNFIIFMCIAVIYSIIYDFSHSAKLLLIHTVFTDLYIMCIVCKSYSSINLVSVFSNSLL
jgi:hypothetical protein